MSELPPEELSTVQLIERLQRQSTDLVKTEIRNAMDEVSAKGTRLGVGIGVSGAGALLLLFGLGTLVAAAVLGLAEAVPAWLAAVIVAAILILVGAVTALVGARRARAAVPPTPEQATQSVRDDVTTVKEHLR
ncbi:phage holin family protein [Gordonia sp. PKS22-38]|uniref:Phage holin family protein n=1 Tax=Gordonia prachuapensis TaxID=3115651 RepID=A0ABU7MN90_9ACTN|nr:phage holin family protein [Gordonia sp. PKS22-38]